MTLELPPSPPAAAAAAAASPRPPLPIVHFTYDMIHRQISEAVEGPRAIFSSWRPTLLICISGGGLVPTRILRSCLSRVAQRVTQADAAAAAAGANGGLPCPAAPVPNVPVQCVGLQLYGTEGLDPATSAPLRTQWIRHDPEAAARRALDEWEEREREQGGASGPAPAPASPAPPSSSPQRAAASQQAPPLVLQGQRVLVVDEVDDTRVTLAACCAELEADAAREKAAYERLLLQLRARGEQRAGKQGEGSGAPAQSPPAWRDLELGVFVVHNKRRPKRGVLSDGIIMAGRYFASSYLPDCWIRYPWDVEDLDAHAEAARRQHAAARVVSPGAAALEGGGEPLRQQRARRRTDAAAPDLLLS